MAYTQADLDRINQAIATGELLVEDGTTRVQYRSIAELQQARQMILDDMARQAAAAAGGAGGGLRVLRFRPVTSRGC